MISSHATPDNLVCALPAGDQGVVAVNIRESQKAVQDFVDELGLTFTVLLDREGEVSKAYGTWGIPLTYIINREGEFVGKVMGYIENGTAKKPLPSFVGSWLKSHRGDRKR